MLLRWLNLMMRDLLLLFLFDKKEIKLDQQDENYLSTTKTFRTTMKRTFNVLRFD